MGSAAWDAGVSSPRLEAGRFYRHPGDGVIRLISADQPDRFGPTGYFEWEIVSTHEKRTAVAPPMPEVDADGPVERSFLTKRLHDHGVRLGLKLLPAVKLSMMLLAADRFDAAEKLRRETERAEAELKLRRERYNAPLDKDLPAAL